MVDGVRTGGFVDDVSLRHVCEIAVKLALQLTFQFEEDTGHAINSKKSAGFSSSERARETWRKARRRDGEDAMNMPIPPAVKVLGQQHRITQASSSLVQNDAVNKYIEAAARIAYLPLPRDK